MRRTTEIISVGLLNNLGVIPGKLATANATRNPGVRAGLKPAPTTAFAGMTVGRSLFISRTLVPGH
jgi:hypothetical protein